MLFFLMKEIHYSHSLKKCYMADSGEGLNAESPKDKINVLH